MFATRRTFLAEAAAAAAVVLLPADNGRAQVGSAAEASRAVHPPAAGAFPERETDSKFNPDGMPRPFAGNTVICHLPAQCVMRDVMTKLHGELEKASYKNRLGLTTVDRAQPVLELGTPEFCTFTDMLRFEPRRLLTCV